MANPRQNRWPMLNYGFISVILDSMLCFFYVIFLAGMLSKSQPVAQCLETLYPYTIIAGVLLTIALLVALVGSYLHRPGILFFSFLVIFVLVIMNLSFVVFISIETHKGPGLVMIDAVNRPQYQKNSVTDYSDWMRKKIRNWSKIESCLSHSNLCEFSNPPVSFSAEVSCPKSLSSMQYGCCLRPLGYDSMFQNQTLNGAVTGDKDCDMWKDDPSTLCYGCESCKGATLAYLKTHMRKTKTVVTTALVVHIPLWLVVVFSLAQILRNKLGQAIEGVTSIWPGAA